MKTKSISPNKINAAQLKMIENIEVGLIGLPTTAATFAETVKTILLAQDFDGQEVNEVKRVKLSILRAVVLQGDNRGLAYISKVKSRLNDRKYFRELERKQTVRGIRTFGKLMGELIIDGYIERGGSKVKPIGEYESYIDQLCKELGYPNGIGAPDELTTNTQAINND